MMNLDLQVLKDEFLIKCKNGVDFISVVMIIWLLIGGIWSFFYIFYDKSVLIFIIGGLLLLVVLGFLKIYKM